MFIFSKKNFIVNRADGSKYHINKGYTGDIPKDVAQSRLVQAAIKGGSIVAPASHSDKDMQAEVEKPAETEKAAEKAKK